MTRPASSLARRSLVSFTWNSFANLVTLPVSFAQTVLLARLLPVEYFGLQAGLLAFSSVAWAALELGLGAAFLHRAPQTEDEERAMAVFFTLRLMTALVWTLIMVGAALVFLDDLRRTALLATALAGGALRVVNAGQTLLARRVQHRRLALMDIAQTGAVFVLSVGIAALSGSIWALLVAPAAMALIFWLALFVWRPVWRPRLSLEPAIVRYFVDYGRRAGVGVFLGVALDHLDDLWINLYLGDLALGYYSRAYRFATYPKVILAEPLNALALGIYAALKQDRLRLSRAFFQLNALLTRSSFGLAGCLVAVAPQFIRLLLGARWLPMLPAFRLLLIYALLEPLKFTISHILSATGLPERVSRARLAQLAALGGGLFVLGPRYGIVGVALAVDLMLFVGIGLLLRDSRTVVDFSPARLFGPPVLALATGMLAVAGLDWAAGAAWNFAGAPWLALAARSLAFGLGYGLPLLALERQALLDSLRWAWAVWIGSRPEGG